MSRCRVHLDCKEDDSNNSIKLTFNIIGNSKNYPYCTIYEAVEHNDGRKRDKVSYHRQGGRNL